MINTKLNNTVSKYKLEEINKKQHITAETPRENVLQDWAIADFKDIMDTFQVDNSTTSERTEELQANESYLYPAIYEIVQRLKAINDVDVPTEIFTNIAFPPRGEDALVSIFSLEKFDYVVDKMQTMIRHGVGKEISKNLFFTEWGSLDPKFVSATKHISKSEDDNKFGINVTVSFRDHVRGTVMPSINFNEKEISSFEFLHSIGKLTDKKTCNAIESLFQRVID